MPPHLPNTNLTQIPPACQVCRDAQLNVWGIMGYNGFMIKEGTLVDFQNWFANYAASFKSGDAEFDRNIIVKEEHTKRVCQEILYIGENIGLNKNDLQLSEIMALFHDVGRFEQYARYGTFADHISVNHAEFGAGILREKSVLKDMDEPDQDLILRAITYHNRRDLPQNETKTCLHFSKMLRDADKLDIWQVFAEYYRNGGEKENSVLIHNFPDSEGISPGIYRELVATRIANYVDVKNLNDFKLLQVGWVYDINFTPTFRRIHERSCLEAIREALPQSEQVEQIFSAARRYLDTKI